MNEYSKPYEIRWTDIDANGHVNYAAYIDATADLRYHFFSEHGFTPEKFEQMGITPVYTSLNAHFLREVRMGEIITITFSVLGLSPSGKRWKVQHNVLKSNGKKAVSIEIKGAIIELATRRLASPTPELLEAFQLIPHNGEIEVLSDMR